MPGQMTLTLLNGSPTMQPQGRTIVDPQFKLGRGEPDGPKVDWMLPDSSRTISRLHCILFHDQHDWFVTDVSRNGTFLNQEPERLPPQTPHRLRNGDHMRIGPYEFQVQFANGEAEERDSGRDAEPGGFKRNVQRGLSPKPQVRRGPLTLPPKNDPPKNDPLWDEQWPDARIGSESGPAGFTPDEALRDDALLVAALEGARLEHLQVHDAADAMRRLGQQFHAMVVGLRMVQAACRTVRSGLRVHKPERNNNPLRTGASDAEVMAALLGIDADAPPADEAVAEAFREIGDHEIATVAAMRTAVNALLASLSPDALRQKADQAGGGMSVPSMQRKACAWDEFEAQYAQIHHGLEDDFDRVFAEAYERTFVVRRQEDGSS